jgi:hypothetical protein
MAMVAGGAVICGLVLLLPAAAVSVLNTLRDAVDTIWLTFKYSDNPQKWSVIAVIIVVGSMFIVSRSARA